MLKTLTGAFFRYQEPRFMGPCYGDTAFYRSLLLVYYILSIGILFSSMR